MLTRAKRTKAPQCIKCSVNLGKRPGTVKVIKTITEAKKLSKLMNMTIVRGDNICKKCTAKYSNCNKENEKEKEKNSEKPKKSVTKTYEEFSWGEESSPSDHSTDDPDFDPENSGDDPDLSNDSDLEPKPAKIPKIDILSEPFKKIDVNSDLCFICESTTDLIEVPLSACQQLTLEARLFVPMEIKCCRTHLENDCFTKEEIDKINIQHRSDKSKTFETSSKT